MGKPITLFEDGSWRLCSDWGYHSAIYHRCNDDTNYWLRMGNAHICGFCETLIPEPLQGLKILYNWDH